MSQGTISSQEEVKCHQELRVGGLQVGGWLQRRGMMRHLLAKP